MLQVMTKRGVMRFNMKKTLDAYSRKGCNVSATCDAVDISRTHFYRMRKKNKKFAQGLDDVYEAIIDDVESALQTKIEKGDITAMIFFLKTKAKKRGYVEKMEVDNKHDIDPVQVWLPHNGRETNTKKNDK